MSLYSHEKICSDCENSKWVNGSEFWDGEPRFARCEIGEESSCDGVTGKCPFYKSICESTTTPEGA